MENAKLQNKNQKGNGDETTKSTKGTKKNWGLTI